MGWKSTQEYCREREKDTMDSAPPLRRGNRGSLDKVSAQVEYYKRNILEVDHTMVIRSIHTISLSSEKGIGGIPHRSPGWPEVLRLQILHKPSAG